MATVKELIETLQKFDPDLEVITAKDEEGNGFNEVFISWIGVSFWNGEDIANEEDFVTDEDDWGPVRSDYRKVVVI